MKCIGICLLFMFMAVQAQKLEGAANDAILLELGASSASALDDTSPQNFKDGSRLALFKMELSKGAVLELHLTSDFDGYLTFYSPSFTVLQTNDDAANDSDGNPDNYESVVISEITESGTHLLVVSGYDASAVGSFELAAKDIPLTLPTNLNALLSEEDDLNDESRYFDTFTLELTKPTTLTLTMTSDIIDSYLKVLDSNGELIIENDDKVFVDDPATTDTDESTDFSLDAEVALTDLPAGTYQVQALSYSTGFYQLIAQSVGGTNPTTPTVTPSKPGSKPGAKPGN
jgi:hypothetical protein